MNTLKIMPIDFIDSLGACNTHVLEDIQAICDKYDDPQLMMAIYYIQFLSINILSDIIGRIHADTDNNAQVALDAYDECVEIICKNLKGEAFREIFTNRNNELKLSLLTE